MGVWDCLPGRAFTNTKPEDTSTASRYLLDVRDDVPHEEVHRRSQLGDVVIRNENILVEKKGPQAFRREVRGTTKVVLLVRSRMKSTRRPISFGAWCGHGTVRLLLGTATFLFQASSAFNS